MYHMTMTNAYKPDLCVECKKEIGLRDRLLYNGGWWHRTCFYGDLDLKKKYGEMRRSGGGGELIL